MSDFEQRARQAGRAVRDQFTTDFENDIDTRIARTKRTARHSQLSTVAAGLIAVALIATIGVGTNNSGSGDNSRVVLGNNGTPFELATSLQAFDKCDDTLAYFKREAPERIFDNRFVPFSGRGGMVASAGAGELSEQNTSGTSATPAPTIPGASRDSAVPDYSQTNVVEAGVDEPDTVKTDGRRIVTVIDNAVQLLEVTPAGPVVRSRLHDLRADRVLLHGDRLLVLSAATSTVGVALSTSQSATTPGSVAPASPDMPSVSPPASASVAPASPVTSTVTSTVSPPASGSVTPVSPSASAGDTPVADAPAIDVAPVDPGYSSSGSTLRSRVALYDISDIAKPTLSSTLEFDGSVMDARLVGSQVRLVTLAQPRIDVQWPTYDERGQITEASKQAARDAVASSKLEEWIPFYTLTDGRGEKIAEGKLIECDAIAAPKTFSGLDTLGVTTFDLSGDLRVDNSAGVVAGGQTVYATASNLYVSTTDYTATGSAATTHIHQFGTSSQGRTTYRASGDVPGTLLGQYAMSEYENVLRVASTVTSSGSVFKASDTHGMVTTLAQQDNVLVQQGQVSGLGQQDNESIRAVRFIADKGYVVTFRQTDPLYVIDLHDPRKPEQVGELKIPGYSGYLHPISKDRLLGVGQAGTQTFAANDCPNCAASAPTAQVDRPTTPAGGVQFSLFDISDPTRPKRLAVQTYGNGQATAEYDTKGFLYWEARKLVVAPIQTYTAYKGSAFQGAVLLEVGDTAMRELGKIEETSTSITRSLVIGNDLYTLSYEAITQTNLDTLHRVARVPLRENPVQNNDDASTQPKKG